MPNPPSFVLGEFRRTLDQRYRVSIPAELAEPFGAAGSNCILAKEQPGALSLWSGARWGDRLERGVRLVESKMDAGRLDGRIDEVQMLGRLLSTRHKRVELGNRGRLLVPEGFREFLGVEPGGELLVVGAALCVELWRPAAWIAHLEQQIPEFRRLFDDLSA
jgi:MraZ protein